MTDIELVEKYKSGDVKAFGEIFEKYSDGLYKFVYLKVSSVEFAEDILSDTFLKALSSLEKFNPKNEGSLKSWLYTIAYNLVKDFYRKHKEKVSIDEIFEIGIELNPEIRMDKVFKKSLKNKLEVTSYAKIRNTKNKKINVAKSGFFSFKKDNSNIFDKPKLNFFKIISPLFVGVFAVFGFINFYGTDLFINNGEKLNYEVEQVVEKKVENTNKNSPIIPFHKTNKQVNSDNIIKEKEKIKTNSLSTEGFRPLNKIENKEKIIIQSKIKKVEKKVENKVEKKVPVLEVEKLNLRTGTEESINTEIIDLLGNDENIENVEDIKTVSSDSMVEFSGNINLEETVPEIFTFIKFCEEKKGIIKNDICEYGELKCSKIDFENNKCD